MGLASRPKPSCSSTSKCSITASVSTPHSAIEAPLSLNRRKKSVRKSQKGWRPWTPQLCALNPVSAKPGELHSYPQVGSSWTCVLRESRADRPQGGSYAAWGVNPREGEHLPIPKLRRADRFRRFEAPSRCRPYGAPEGGLRDRSLGCPPPSYPQVSRSST